MNRLKKAAQIIGAIILGIVGGVALAHGLAYRKETGSFLLIMIWYGWIMLFAWIIFVVLFL